MLVMSCVMHDEWLVHIINMFYLEGPSFVLQKTVNQKTAEIFAHLVELSCIKCE